MKTKAKSQGSSFWTIALILVSLPALGGRCSDPIYSEECSDLADDLSGRIQAIAGKYGACEADADCTYAAVVIACNRDYVDNTVVRSAESEAFRRDIVSVSASECTAENIDDCNAHCGTQGELVFQITAASCVETQCRPVPLEGDSDASLPSAEICHPSKNVYLPEDLGDGLSK